MIRLDVLLYLIIIHFIIKTFYFNEIHLQPYLNNENIYRFINHLLNIILTIFFILNHIIF